MSPAERPDDAVHAAPRAAPRVAVLGGTGFLGRAIVERCASRGIEAWPVARGRGDTSRTPTFRGADLLTGDGLAAALSGADVVIHAAGLAHKHGGATLAAMHASNADATRRAVEYAAAAGTRRFVLVSSVSVYGGTSVPATEETRCNPKSPYGISKLAGEQMARDVASERGVELIVLRMATLYGAGDPGNFARLIRALQHGVPIGVDGRRVCKSVIHRRDAADACLLTVGPATPLQGTFNVVGGIHSLDEIVATIASLLQRRSPARLVSRAAALRVASMLRHVSAIRSFAVALERLLANEAYSGREFHRAFGFSPAVSLRDGLEEEIEWLRAPEENTQ